MQKLIFGCGYLGRRVADAWLKRGHDVAAVTRSEKNAEGFRRAGIVPILADVTKPESLKGFPKVKTVLFAVGYDRTAGPSQYDVYVTGLENALRAIDGRFERFVHISSTSVYGQNAGEWVDENSECRPAAAGGRVCLAAEQVVHRFFSRDNISGSECRPIANVLRLAGLYGPGRLLRRIEQLKSREPIAGNPDAFLNLIHVEDAAAAVLACEERGRPGATYLVCDDRPLTRREYYETLSRLAGVEPPMFADTAESAHANDGLNKRCSNAVMRERLGVEPAFANAEIGLRQALSISEP